MQVIVLTLVSMLMWGLVDSVRIVELRVAAHMAEGSDALLGCTFDMADEALYSLKWYKDGKEFFRYVPKAVPTMKAFFMPGVMVDLNRSSVNVVALKRLTRESAGVYQCEVKAEAPTFDMVSADSSVAVDLLPERGPRVIGLKDVYHIGSQVTVNCTTPPSRPEAQLQWLINDQPVSPSYLRGPFLVIPTDRPFTYQPKLMLNFTVHPGHFNNERAMTLKCQAAIPPLYHQEKAYTFYESVIQTTTEECRDHVATTDIPSVLLFLQTMLLLLVI